QQSLQQQQQQQQQQNLAAQGSLFRPPSVSQLSSVPVLPMAQYAQLPQSTMAGSAGVPPMAPRGQSQLAIAPPQLQALAHSQHQLNQQHQQQRQYVIAAAAAQRQLLQQHQARLETAEIDQFFHDLQQHPPQVLHDTPP
ncbi:MAG: hypothetical protein BJ554DRAFT_3276, partial [Olpidium bornovanus]